MLTKLLLRIFITTILLFAFNAKAENSCASYKKDLANDQEYRVVFGDSGVGGLIFALDVAQELETKLKALETQYKVRFTFNHFGDSKNAPYGNKKPEEIKALTAAFLEYLLNLSNTHTAVIACNTASTIYDTKMNDFFTDKYRDVKIITMIDDSAAALVKSAQDKNPYIALMATPATIKSGAYQNKISELAKDKNVKLYNYAPKNWTQNIETGLNKNSAEFEVNSDLEAFRSQTGQDFNKISVVGLFCTHYPFYKNQIQEFFNKNGNPNITVLTQGHIFSDKIYADIEQNMNKLLYRKRVKKLPYDCTKNITINSELSGDNIEQTKKVISHTHPQYLQKISFKKITIN